MRFPRWLKVLSIVVLVLAVACGACYWWLESDGDWKRIEAEAKAAGFTCVQEDVIAQVRDEAIQAPVLALGTLAKQIEVVTHDMTPDGLERMRAAMTKHVSAITEVERGVDALGDETGPATMLFNDVPRVLAARIMTCGPEELDACVLRALRLWKHPTSVPRVLELHLRACTMRIADLRGHEAVAVAIDAACELMAAKQLASERLRFAELADLLHRPMTAGRTWPVRMSMRADREAWLRAYVVMMAKERQNPDLATWAGLFPAPAIYQKAPLSGLMMEEVTGDYQRDCASVALHARLLAAELRGAPWPKDWFDPAGGQLRRIERGGTLIGAYSVGENTIDDGGNNLDHLSHGKDLCWRLYEQLGVPKASDAMTPVVMPVVMP